MKSDPRIEYSSRFNRQRTTAPLEVKEAFLEALRFFLVDPNHAGLRNHPLTGKYTGYRSINVTDDYRAIFRETQTAKDIIITFHFLGTHKVLFG